MLLLERNAQPELPDSEGRYSVHVYVVYWSISIWQEPGLGSSKLQCLSFLGLNGFVVSCLGHVWILSNLFKI